MNFAWQKYIELAENILQNNNEAYFRTAISRAYYGIFCIARNKKQLINHSSRVHQLVKNEYLNSNIETEREIGRLLDSLRRDRNDADYNDSTRITKQLAERCVLKAKYCLNLLNNL